VRRAGDTRLGPPTPRVALVIVAAVAVAFLLWLGRDAIGPFVVGLLLVYLLDPAVERLGHIGVPRSLSIVLVYAVFVVALVVVLYLTIPPLLQQIGQFFRAPPQLSALIQDTIAQIRQASHPLAIGRGPVRDRPPARRSGGAASAGSRSSSTRSPASSPRRSASSSSRSGSSTSSRTGHR
jgi:hypothetical protein